MQPPSADESWYFEGRDSLEAILKEKDISKEEICLVGSITLSARGLREHGDIDIALKQEVRKSIDEDTFDHPLYLVEDRYDVIDIADDELIDDSDYHDVIDGCKVVRPELEFSFKKLRGLQKDEQDIKLLKAYSQSTDDWDWDLYRADYGERPNTLLSRGIQSLRNDGLLITLDKLIGLLHRKVPIARRFSALLPVYDLSTPVDALRGKTRIIDAGELLNRQYDGNRFVGYDIVLAWIDVNEEWASSSGENPTRQPIDNTGGKTSGPIKVSLKHHVIDPDRFVETIDSGQLDIEMIVSMSGSKSYDEQWIQSNVANQERAAIEEARIDLLERTGAIFYALLWPPAHEYFEEMEAVLGNEVKILDSEDIEIDDIHAFTKAVYDAQAEPAPAWSIDWKAEQMTKFRPIVRFVKIELPNPRIRDGISREMEMVKNDVRHAFMDRFPDEYYLSLMHASDSFADNRGLREVVETHRAD